MRDSEIPLRIVLAAIYSDKPVTMTQLAKKAGLPRQLVSYHIPRLISEGLLLPVEEGKRDPPLFSPQLIFADEKLSREVIKLAEPIIEKISENLIVSDKEDAERVLRNNAHVLLTMLAREALRRKR